MFSRYISKIYAKYNGDFDRIYTEGYNNKPYTGRVIEPGKVYELSYLECTCPKVKCGLRNHPQQCECSRQSILYPSQNPLALLSVHNDEWFHRPWR